jgi:DNA polymerase-3 subunit beta
MKVNSKQLLAALKKLSGAINNPSVPVLANVRIITGLDQVNLIGTNLNQTIKVTLPCEVKTQIDTTINFKRITAICSQLVDDYVKITIKDDTAALKCGKSRFKLACINSDQWPIDNVEGDFKEITLDYKTIKEQIHQVFYAASKDESRAVLNGILFEVKERDFNTVATDGKRLAVSSVYGMQQEDLNISFICPVGVLMDVIKNASDYINLKIYESKLSVKSGNYEVTTKLIEGNYPNYTQIIPGSFAGKLHINKVALLEAVQRVSLILDSFTESIKLVFNGNELHVTAQTQDSAQETILIESETNEEFSFNPIFLIDVLKNLDTDHVMLNYNDSISPTLISANNLKYILMPMRG